jgi:hypothetical protein
MLLGLSKTKSHQISLLFTVTDPSEFCLVLHLNLLSVVGIIILAVMVGNLKLRCRQLEDSQNDNMKVIHNRVTTVANNLQDDINNVADSVEKNYAAISETRTILKNTNHALVRTNNKLEKEVDRLTEELKKD